MRSIKFFSYVVIGFFLITGFSNITNAQNWVSSCVRSGQTVAKISEATSDLCEEKRVLQHAGNIGGGGSARTTCSSCKLDSGGAQTPMGEMCTDFNDQCEQSVSRWYLPGDRSTVFTWTDGNSAAKTACENTTITQNGITLRCEAKPYPAPNSDSGKVGVCSAPMTSDKCGDYCVVYRTSPNSDQYRQQCAGSQSGCVEVRDDEISKESDHIISWPSCGEQQPTTETGFTGLECIDINRECKNLNEDDCSGARVEKNGTLYAKCQWVGKDGMKCVANINGTPPNICANFCRADVDWIDETECYETQAACEMDRQRENANKKEQINNSCGAQIVGSVGAKWGNGVDSSFSLNGFKPFQPIGTLYSNKSLPGFVNTFLQFLIGISGVIVVIMIVGGGFQYVLSAASTQKTDAKEQITNALLGLGLLLGSVALLNTINPALLKLNTLKPIEVTLTREEFDNSGYSGGYTLHQPYCFTDNNDQIICRSDKDACTLAMDQCANSNTCQVKEACSSGGAQKLAQLILESPNISWDSRYRAQVEAYSQGNFECHIDPLILQLIYGLSVENTFTVTSINRFCTQVLTDSGEASYHYRDGGGRAVDFGTVNGQGDFNTNAGRAEAAKIFQEALQYLPPGSGFGQNQCGIPFNLPSGYRYFGDPCDHLHFQVPLN